MKLTSILTATCCVLFTSAAMAQGNDDCANATPLSGDGVFAVDNTIGTGLDADPGCGNLGADVWYGWTATTTGTVNMNMCDGTTTYDSALALWDGSGCPTSLITCNDDSCGLQSGLIASVVAGNAYMVQVGGYNGATGTGNLTITTQPPGGGNDDCANATAISGPGIYNFDNSAATMDGAPDILCDEYGTQDIDLDVWFAYTAASTATVTVETCTSSLTVDTKIAAYDGTCGGAILDCNDDTCGLQSMITFAATAGNVYILRVGSFTGAGGGADTFAVTEGGGGGGSGNDDCANAEDITGQGSFNYDNTTATMDGAGDILCDAFGTQDIDQDVWFRWTADDTGTATVETCNGAGGDTKIAAYDAGCGSAMLACNDDTCGLASQIMFSVTNGAVYMLRVGSYPGAAGGAGFFDISIDGGGGGGCVDSVYCSSLPNSTGATASIGWSGSCVVADNNFTLDMAGGPGNQPGLFIYGANQASIPFGNGILCISAPIIRLNPPVFMDSAGTASKVIDLANPPSQTGLITAGSQWNFAMWLRDPAAGGAGYTFTDGLSVDFQ